MNKKFFFSLMGFITLFVFLSFPYKQVLVIEQENTKKILAYTPLENKDRFIIKYTHSIHLSDVLEHYKILENGNIMQTQLVYEDYAIGMPSGALNGEVFSSKDGKITISNMEREFLYIDLRIGQIVSNHQLIVNNIPYKFSRFVKPGAWVRIKHRKINLYEVLKGVNIGGT
jgi:hypothetical protein